MRNNLQEIAGSIQCSSFRVHGESEKTVNGVWINPFDKTSCSDQEVIYSAGKRKSNRLHPLHHLSQGISTELPHSSHGEFCSAVPADRVELKDNPVARLISPWCRLMICNRFFKIKPQSWALLHGLECCGLAVSTGEGLVVVDGYGLTPNGGVPLIFRGIKELLLGNIICHCVASYLALIFKSEARSFGLSEEIEEML